MFLPPKVKMESLVHSHIRLHLFSIQFLMCTVAASLHDNSVWCALLWTLEKWFKKARTTNTRNSPSSPTNSKRAFNALWWTNRESHGHVDPVAHRPGVLWMHQEIYTRQIKPQEEMMEKWDFRRTIMTTRERINHIRILIYSHKCFKRT